MRIVFTEHSKRKIEQRGLKREFVEKTLVSPDFVKETYGDRKVAYRQFSKLYLAVVFKVEGEDFIVITSHWEENFKLK